MDSAGRSIANWRELSNPAGNSSSIKKITILVVDGNPASLASISAMLELWGYEVAAVTSSVDALYTLREHPSIDLVLAEVDMPQIDGIELLRRIKQEFEVPVIMMYSNDEDSVIEQCFTGGAVFFIVKPVNPYDLKDLWQYPIAKKGKPVVIEEIGSTVTVGDSSDGSSDENNNAKRVSKRKASRKGKDDQEEETSSARKKDKMVWTNSLHNRFLEAIREIGPDQSMEVVPKWILEHMNVRGLTRENVASHLQKYRNFLKDVERSHLLSKAFAERVLRSSFASDHPLLLKAAQEYYMEVQQQQRMSGLKFQPGYAGIVSDHVATSPGSVLFPNQNASSSNSTQPHGYGQSSLLENQAYKRQVLSGNMNPLYQGNRLQYANGWNLSKMGGFSGGIINASNGLMNGVKSMHTYPQQIQAGPNFYNAGSSSHFSFGLMTGTCNQNMNLAVMGNQTSGVKAEGGVSSTGSDGANQVSPAYTAANLMNIASDPDNITLSQQPGDSDLLLQSKNYKFPNQVGADGVQDPESEALYLEIYSKLGELLNSDFPESFSAEETAPGSEHALKQVQSGFEVLINTNVNGGAYPSDEPSPTINQNTNQQQSGGEQLADSESSCAFPENNAPASGYSSDNESCGDDLKDEPEDSFFGVGPRLD